MISLSDCRCIACDGTLSVIHPFDGEEIVEHAIGCTACGATYDAAWGVPFLGQYDQDDFAGLVEIAANAEDRSPFTPEDLDHWHELLSTYHTAKDREAVLKAAGPGRAPWVPNRYNEWVQLETLAAGENWQGRKVLDVGAGLGFDSFRHVRAGAQVTALEISPANAREGRRTLPMIRWIGGASHALPFADATFDAVFSNAALHHMRSIPVGLAEMLRVLRPGGLLITTGDSYRADRQGEEAELEIFNSHPAVLNGINERVPRLCEFIDVLEQLGSSITPRLFTQIVYNAHRLAGQKTVEGFREWNFASDSGALRETSGSIALKIRLERPTGTRAQRVAPHGALRAGTLANWLTSQTEAMAKLAAWAPAEVINAPFPGTRGSKFELLNGWQIPTGLPRLQRLIGKPWRQAFRRARWYLDRTEDQRRLRFDLKAGRGAPFEIRINGLSVQIATVIKDHWTPVAVDLGALPPSTPFSVEIRMQNPPEDFDGGLFRVRDRRLG